MDDEDRLDVLSRTKVSFNQGKIWCLVTQRDNVCFSFKFKEDAKGQDVMDEVNNKFSQPCLGYKVHLKTKDIF